MTYGSYGQNNPSHNPKPRAEGVQHLGSLAGHWRFRVKGQQYPLYTYKTMSQFQIVPSSPSLLTDQQ